MANKPEQRVWIAQCLCPDRHCVMGAAGEAGDQATAEAEIMAPLREKIAELLAKDVINPWCSICHAGADTWRYEGRTRFRTLEEALPELARSEAQQRATAALLGDMPRSD